MRQKSKRLVGTIYVRSEPTCHFFFITMDPKKCLYSRGLAAADISGDNRGNCRGHCHGHCHGLRREHSRGVPWTRPWVWPRTLPWTSPLTSVANGVVAGHGHCRGIDRARPRHATACHGHVRGYPQKSKKISLGSGQVWSGWVGWSGLLRIFRSRESSCGQ